MIDNQNIQEYYINYHELQSLLEEVTKIVFQDISDELVLGQFEV